ncbi:MAG: AsmA-like C-terminal region-containing protein [Bacteroidales bacterium]
MRKYLKISGIVLAILLVLSLILPVAFKGRIVSAVKKEVNKNLNAVIDFGGFGFTLLRSFPDFTLNMKNIIIVGSGDFKGDTLANIPSLQVTVDVMSVIKGEQYEVKKIVINDPRFLFHVLPDGKANWDIMKPSAPKESSDEVPSPFRLMLQEIIISKASIAYRDEELGFSGTFLGIDHQLSGSLADDSGSFELELSSQSITADYGGIRYLNAATVNLKTKLDTDLKNYKFTFADALLKFNELTLSASGFFAMPVAGYDMDIKFAARENTFKNFLSLVPAIYSKDFDKIETKGTMAFDGFVKGIYNDTQIPAFGLHLGVNNAMFKYPGLPGAVTDIAIKADITNPDGIPDNTIIDVPLFKMKVVNNPIEAKLSLRTPVSDPQFNVTVNGSLDLANLPKVYPMAQGYSMSGLIKADLSMAGKLSDIEKEQYGNVIAIGKMEALQVNLHYPGLPSPVNVSNAILNFSPAFIELAAFRMKTGKSDLSATGKLENYLPYFLKDGEVLAGNLSVKSVFLDINQLMPADSGSSTADSSTSAAIEIPGNINFILNASFSKLIYDKYTMDNVSGIVKVKDKKIFFDNLKMNMLGGAIAMNGTYDAVEPAKPLMDIAFDLKDVDVQQAVATFNTVEKLAPIATKVKGIISAKLNMKTRLGGDMSPVLSSLSGNGTLLSPLLTIENVNTMNKIADALKMDKLRKWSLEKVNLSYEFIDGKVFVKPFPTNMGNIKANLGGSTGFDQSLDYTCNMEIPRSEFGGKANNVLTGLVADANKKGANFRLGDLVPVTLLVGGTVISPSITTNLKGSMNSAVDDLKNQAKEELNKKKAEAETKAKGEANKLIEDADKRAAQLIADAAKQGQQLIDAAHSGADKLKAEAATRSDQIKAEGKKNGPLAAIAANKAAEKVNKEAADKGSKMIVEAEKQSKSLQDKAGAEASVIKQHARDKAGIK